MSVLVCTDLDRTLIYSRRAAGDVTASAMRCVEIVDGAEISFLTRRAAATLRALDRAALWVPATTRTTTQYRRVRLPRVREGGYALCANGGVLLADGVPDRDWAARVREVVAASAPIEEVTTELRRRAALLADGAVGPVRDAEGLFRYVVVDRSLLPTGWVEDFTGWCRARRWRTSLQGRKFYCLPADLTKSAAVRELARRLEAHAVLAAGDSMLDADLLEAADAGIRPAHGELETAGWGREHVAVTTTTGARAGEEIARWLLAGASAARDGAGRAARRDRHLLPVVQRSPQP